MSGLGIELAGPVDPCDEPILTRDQYVSQVIVGIDPDEAFGMYLHLRNWTCGDAPAPAVVVRPVGFTDAELIRFVFDGPDLHLPPPAVPLPATGLLLIGALAVVAGLQTLRRKRR